MIGKIISHYKILAKLGEGGMGVVYKAENVKLKRMVALKFLPPALTADPQAKKRFVQEAQAASSLKHKNICTIHDIDETDDGQLFMVMDYYEGRTLKEIIEGGEIPSLEKEGTPEAKAPFPKGGFRGILNIEQVVDIVVQISAGLAGGQPGKFALCRPDQRK